MHECLCYLQSNAVMSTIILLVETVALEEKRGFRSYKYYQADAGFSPRIWPPLTCHFVLPDYTLAIFVC